jgi:hypothetical protein
MSKNTTSKTVEKLFVRTLEAAIMIDCSESHINSLIKEGKINSYLPSPKVRLIEVASLIAYVKNNYEVNYDEN